MRFLLVLASVGINGKQGASNGFVRDSCGSGGGMAHLHRLIFVALVAFMSWLPASSYATMYATCPLAADAAAASAAAWLKAQVDGYNACAAVYAPSGCAGGPPTAASASLMGGEYRINYLYAYSSASGTPNVTDISPVGAFACPASDPNAARCLLLKGQTGYATMPGRVMPGAPSCSSDGCAATTSSTLFIVTGKVTGLTTTQGDVVFTGASCTPAPSGGGASDPSLPPPPPVATPSTCVGGSVGQVNGVQVCVPYDPAKNTLETTKTGSSTTATGVPGGPDGGPSGAAGAGSAPTTASTTSTDSTVCSGSMCTTTKFTTTDKGDGSTPTITKDVTTAPQTDYCVKNASDPICKSNTSSYTGSCGTPPVCTGDAVQCAQAQYAQQAACALSPAAGPESALYDAAKVLSGNQTTNLPGNSSIAISSSSFDSTELLGASGGMQDLTVTVAGKTVNLPMSQVNVWLERLGRVLQAVTFLVCLKIVTRES